MKKNAIIIIAIAVVVVIAIAAFYFLKTTPAPVEKEQGSATGEGASVALKSYKFVPETVNIGAGEKVTWRNSDGVTHDITFDNGMFKNDILPGQTITIVFNETGEYSYMSKRHPSMKGRVVVG